MAKRYKKRYDKYRRNKYRAEKDLLIAVVIALLLQLVPIIYKTPNYGELSVKNITVESVGVNQGNHRSATRYYLKTADGDKMEIRGELSYQELCGKLQPGTEATVKYYRGIFILEGRDFIKELICDGEILVAYEGDTQKEDQIVFLCIGGLVVLLGLFFYDMQKNSAQRSTRRYMKKLEKWKAAEQAADKK